MTAWLLFIGFLMTVGILYRIDLERCIRRTQKRARESLPDLLCSHFSAPRYDGTRDVK